MIVLWILLGILGLALLYVLFLFVIAAFVDKNKLYNKDSRFYRAILNGATGFAMRVVRVHIHVEGAEKLPEGRFFLVSNHRSKFDPIITWYAFRKRPIAFISKPENFKIPVFGRIVRRCCFMPINRDDAREAMTAIRQAAGLLTSDAVNVGIYPEGTRNPTDTMLPFHDGVFLIAQKAKVPIVAVTVRDTELVAKRYPWKSTHVYLTVRGVIPAETVAASRSGALSAMARELMA